MFFSREEKVDFTRDSQMYNLAIKIYVIGRKQKIEKKFYKE